MDNKEMEIGWVGWIVLTVIAFGLAWMFLSIGDFFLEAKEYLKRH